MSFRCEQFSGLRACRFLHRGDWDYSVVWYYPIRIKILIQPLDPIPWIDAMYVVQTEIVLPSFIQILTL